MVCSSNEERHSLSNDMYEGRSQQTRNMSGVVTKNGILDILLLLLLYASCTWYEVRPCVFDVALDVFMM